MMLLFAMLAAATPNADAGFEQLWSEIRDVAARDGLSREGARVMYEVSQTHFSLGFCSSLIPADEMYRMRNMRLDEQLVSRAGGIASLQSADQSFRAGMDFRSEVQPTHRLCDREMEGRASALAAANRAFEASEAAAERLRAPTTTTAPATTRPPRP